MHPCPSPVATSTAELAPGTLCGVFWSAPTPEPSWPVSLAPQQLTLALFRITQVKSGPVARPCDGLGVKASTGVADGEFVPSPSWPAVLSPQQLTPPPVRTAQLCAPPALTPMA